MNHYDINGQPITMAEWAAQLEAGRRRVAETEVGALRVSTVWLGLDHSFGDGPPLIFETMVFEGGDVADVGDLAQNRYSTLAEAEAGHASTVAQLERMPSARDH